MTRLKKPRLSFTELESRHVPSGTPTLVADINPSGNSFPDGTIAIGGTLYFSADGGSGLGVELYSSDGKTASLVADINPGSADSFPTFLTESGGKIFFSASIAGASTLYVTDGTATGTFALGALSNPTSLTNVNGKLFFFASDSASGREVWTSDGTAQGTTLVADINPGPASSIAGPDSDFPNIPAGVAVGNFFYFAADDSNGSVGSGVELWKTDGVTTTRVTDLEPGFGSSNPYSLTEFNGKVAFFATGTGTTATPELWISDGITTTQLSTIAVNDGGMAPPPGELYNFGGTLVFSAANLSGGRELALSDGTAANTGIFQDINPSGDSNPHDFTNIGGALYFSADDGSTGQELWIYIPGDNNARLVVDLWPGPLGSLPYEITDLNGVAYFGANTSDTPSELYATDGTAVGTTLIDVEATTDAGPYALVVDGSTLYFSAFRSDVGYELFSLFVDTTPPTISDIPDQFVVAGDTVGPLDFTINDDFALPDNLVLTASSNNPAIPSSAITFGGSGTDRTITVSTPAGVSTSTLITVTVTDPANGTSSFDTFTITQSFPPTPPTISDIPNQVVVAGDPVGPLTFTIGDDFSQPSELVVFASSDNVAIPATAITLGGSGATRTITISTTPGVNAITTITVTVLDPSNNTQASDTFTITQIVPVIPPVNPLTKEFAVGRGSEAPSIARLYNADGTVRFEVTPFGTIYDCGVRTVAADFNGDGITDLAVASGYHPPSHWIKTVAISTTVIVYDGATQAILFQIEPFGHDFTLGANLSAGDLNGDGRAELAITPERGGGARIRIFTMNSAGFVQLADFFGLQDSNGNADKTFRGGGRSAMGDVNADGYADFFFAAGTGGGPRVALFNGRTITSNGGIKLCGDFLVFESSLRNGSYLSSGDIDGDGFADLVATPAYGGGPRVSIFSGIELLANRQVKLADFFVGNPNDRSGLRTAVKDLDGDTLGDLVLGAGPNVSNQVIGLHGTDLAAGTIFDFPAFDSNPVGVFVG